MLLKPLRQQWQLLAPQEKVDQENHVYSLSLQLNFLSFHRLDSSSKSFEQTERRSLLTSARPQKFR